MDPQNTPAVPPEEKDNATVPDLGAPAVSPDNNGQPAASGPAVFSGNTPEETPAFGAPDVPSSAGSDASADGPAEPLPDASREPAEPEAVAGQTFSPSSSSSPESAPPAGPSWASSAPATPAADQAPSSMPPGPVPEANDMQDNPLPMAPTKRGKKGLIFGLIVAAVVLLLSGGAAASYYYFVSNKPENILKQALANSVDPEKTKTTRYSVSMAVGDEEMTVNASFKMAFDDATGAFDVSGTADALITTLKFDARSTDGKTYYFKVGGLDGLSELMGSTGLTEAYAPVIALINDQWIEINQSFVEQMSKEAGMDFSTVLSDADKRKIGEAYMKYPFVVLKEVLPAENINGKSSYHYKVAIDPAVLKTFVVALKEANLDVYKPDQKAIDAINKAIDQAKFDETPFEVWIDKGSKMFSQFRVTAEEEGVKTDLKMTVDSYNQPVKVDKPEGAKSILEIVGEFSKLLNDEYGDLLGGATLPEGISL